MNRIFVTEVISTIDQQIFSYITSTFSSHHFTFVFMLSSTPSTYVHLLLISLLPFTIFIIYIFSTFYLHLVLFSFLNLKVHFCQSLIHPSFIFILFSSYLFFFSSLFISFHLSFFLPSFFVSFFFSFLLFFFFSFSLFSFFPFFFLSLPSFLPDSTYYSFSRCHWIRNSLCGSSWSWSNTKWFRCSYHWRNGKNQIWFTDNRRVFHTTFWRCSVLLMG